MKYLTMISGKRKIEGVSVEYNGETIDFRGTQNVNGGDASQPLFEFLNDYFEGQQPQKLDQLWALLKEGKRILEPGYFDEPETTEVIELRERGLDYHFLIDKLTPVIERIYRTILPHEVAYAAQISGRTMAPRDLMQMAVMGDYPEETTINPAKYAELVKLAFVAQVSFPVMNQLLDKIVQVTGKDYQFAVAGEIITRFSSITNMEGWRILDTYIRASCERQESRRNTLEVVSNDRYMDNIIFRGLFIKLCLTFIPSLDKDKNLSKQLNSLVEGEIRKEQSTRFKSFADHKPGSEDQSIPESFRIAQSVNGSDELAQAEFFTFGMFDENEKPHYTDFFYYQCKALGIKNQALAEKVYNCLPTVWNFRLTNIHIQLLQTLYRDDIGNYLVPALYYPQLMAAIVLAQVKFFEMGYENLAMLCGVIRNPEHPISYLGDEFKLTTKEREMLVEHCAMYEGQSQSSTDNMLVKAVQAILDELENSGWDSNVEPGLLGNQEFIDLMSPGDLYQVSLTVDVKEELLDFVMKTTQAEVVDQE